MLAYNSGMSTLFLATSPAPLAARLAEIVDRNSRNASLFVPVEIVIPNRFLGQWLRFWIARRHGIAANLRFSFLEDILWNMLRAVDPRVHQATPELLDAVTYRLLVLAVLLTEEGPALASLQRYFRGDTGALPAGLAREPLPSSQSTRGWRRACQLSDLLGQLIRDYEYHRQEALIQPWIKNQLILRGTPLAELEAVQAAVFEHIIRMEGGKRAVLNDKTARNFKTLPQYALEVLEVLEQAALSPGRPPQSRTTGGEPAPSLVPGAAIHFFGLTPISPLHLSTLHWLGGFFDLHVYHLNPLVAQLPTAVSSKALTELAKDFSEAAPETGAVDDLLAAWGQAGAESLGLMGRLLTGFYESASRQAPRNGILYLSNNQTRFQFEVVKRGRATTGDHAKKSQSRKTPVASVLGRLQQRLLGLGVTAAAPTARISQDRSLQIVGCPGAMREVETVYYSILDNLQKNPSLQLTDVAVLVTDMVKYRPLIQSVFDRQPRNVTYSLVDYSAAGASTFGKAVLDILNLALESFTHTRVFEVLLNPCFLARLGVDRAQTLTWARWADELGIYQGWDEADRMERGYVPSPRFGWRLALQRLRLGRFMEAPPGASGRPAPRFGDLVPFADLDSRDREQLDSFTRAVEGLLPTLANLRGRQATGKGWGEILRHLLQTFLDVPADRPEEGQVRDRLLRALDQLAFWDHVGVNVTLPLSLVRDFIDDHLKGIEGRYGDYLAGVTVSALQSMRPVPFKLVYIVGLGADLFPGSNTLSAFDLRSHRRLPGDIRPAEHKRFIFLEALLAAQEKIYLLYNNRDLQKDHELLPAGPLLQLERYLGEHLLTKAFVPARVPLHDHDPETLIQPSPAEYDVGTQVSELDRLLAVAQARETGIVSLDIYDEGEFQERWQRRATDFSPPPSRPSRPEAATVTIAELARFLRNPAEAALKRHLYLTKEEERELPRDDEPFFGSSQFAGHLTRQVLQSFVTEAAQESLSAAMEHWPERFRQLYEEEELRCRAPGHAFGAADQSFLFQELEGRITGALADFLQQRDGRAFCGPVVLGTTLTPVGARLRFPAAVLNFAEHIPVRSVFQARLSGFAPLVWAGEQIEVLVITSAGDIEECKLNKSLFDPVLFYLALGLSVPTAPGELSAAQWLAGRQLHVFVAGRDAVCRYAYASSAEEARAYLTHLAADFLDPTTFDLLPFDVIIKDADKDTSLAAAYSLAADQLGDLPATYYQRLHERVEEEQESDFGGYWRSPLLDLAKVQAPEDAFAKVRRRFRLLDQGPRQNRDEQTRQQE
jgi:exonuclease V gamma subunit